jgi:hypothetical protein
MNEGTAASPAASRTGAESEPQPTAAHYRLHGGEVAGAVGDRAAMLAGGLAAALATVVAWRASTHPACCRPGIHRR